METGHNKQSVFPPWMLSGMALTALAVLVFAATPPGAVAASGVQRFLDFYAGVFTLLAMSLAVVTGLIATDRMFLRVRHRVFVQGVHRAASLITFTMVVAHVMVKVLAGRVTPAQVVVPTGDAIGVGTVAFELLVVVLVMGLLRARFAESRFPKLWRMMHGLAYVGWPLAITHGLIAGRAAANWVILGYLFCAGAVFVAAIARVMVTMGPRREPQRGPENAPAPVVNIQLTEAQLNDLQTQTQQSRAAQGPGMMR